MKTTQLIFVSLCLILLVAGGITATTNVGAQEQSEDATPYTVVDGKVDKNTYNGFRRYHGICHTCHGPDALGSTIGPSLVKSLQTLTYEEFKTTVLEGRVGTTPQGQPNVMLAFKTNPDIVKYLDDIYGYVKARSDGAIGPGRPQKIK